MVSWEAKGIQNAETNDAYVDNGVYPGAGCFLHRPGMRAGTTGFVALVQGDEVFLGSLLFSQ